MAIMAGALIDVADYADTGWVDCTMESGSVEVGGHDVQVRRIGNIVFLRGRMTRATSSTTQTWATVPDGFRPDRIVEIPHRAQEGAASAPDRVFLNTNGTLDSQGTPTTTAAVNINASWIVAE
jgi:hypothetical protein